MAQTGSANSSLSVAKDGEEEEGFTLTASLPTLPPTSFPLCLVTSMETTQPESPAAKIDRRQSYDGRPYLGPPYTGPIKPNRTRILCMDEARRLLRLWAEVQVRDHGRESRMGPQGYDRDFTRGRADDASSVEAYVESTPGFDRYHWAVYMVWVKKWNGDEIEKQSGRFERLLARRTVSSPWLAPKILEPVCGQDEIMRAVAMAEFEAGKKYRTASKA